MDKVEFLFDNFGFEVMNIHVISLKKKKNSNDFAENFSRIFQNFCFFEIRSIESVFWLIEMWRRKMAFYFKSLEFLRFLPDSFQLVEPVFMWISIPARFLSIDQISDFKNKRGIRSDFFKRAFCLSLRFLSWSLFSNFFFGSFLWPKLRRFSSYT